ncbi:4-hydroxy-3-methylbut-2-enyl diphosphate reductase [Trebonia kvetii]|uniref:4-hydroxy-3-methylbut-2-enyl diphosphate reductase n=1 Tax=Trebonia kvetii TaxID=2480626 RepID=A0A6P2C4P5_9ACTN|nr:4-hydroxy-3-methylbut-2-enyl diphosphate reductase [Trebonia kvetii]TVZ06198.1 4-hydroxy-3-methylbut-2-enyl diphosphate reductase [Trebonia kvetii]
MTETIPQPRTHVAADRIEDTAPESAKPGLLVFAPLRIEANAVRRGLTRPGSQVLRTGMGGTRAKRSAVKSQPHSFGATVVMGTAAGLSDDLSPGDLVVATEVSDGETTVALPGAALLAAELRRAGLNARAGRLVTVGKLVRSAERVRLASDGYLAADMESAALVAALAGTAAGHPVAVIRAVSDAGFGPGMVSGGMAALRSLRLAAPVAEKWAAACRQRTVLLAGPRSFCAGVERAIEIVERALELRGAPVYVRKQIVHNTRVVSDLEQRGAVFVDELDEVPDGATVVFSAHGVSPAVRTDASGRGLSVIDATCPLVSKVHAEARRFAREGYTVALIGHAGHEEVEGTLGEAPDSTVLVQTAQDVASLDVADPSKLAFLMQTTLAIDEAADVAGALRDKFPQMRAPGSDDICYATTNRQAAVRAVAAEADLVLVAGSANSSNSVRLVERSQRDGTPAHLIDGATDIDLAWLSGVSVVGLTAGASAPPAVVSEIIDALSGLGTVTVTERVTTTESVQFGLPREVR